LCSFFLGHAVKKALRRSERRLFHCFTLGEQLVQGTARNAIPHGRAPLAATGTGEAVDSCHGWTPKLISSGGRSL